MDFISWLVFGALFILAEFGFGNAYLFSTGLACIYPSIASFTGAPTGTQLLVFGIGSVIHALVVKILRKRPASGTTENLQADVGARVDIIEWIDESSARVSYRGTEWFAEKMNDAMPCSAHATIVKLQYGRLIIATEAEPETNTQS
jgi:membrane protein implicated in regulation of membrane protease activity